MTGPLGGGSLGDAYINVHANTDDVEGDIEKGLGKAGKGAEGDADNVGKNLGTHIGDGVEKEVGRRGPGIGRSIKDAVEKEVIDVRPNLRYNVRGRDGRFVSRASAGIKQEVEDAFSSAVTGGGFLSSFSAAIRDAIGAGFNVSGKSPLIYALIPAITALVGVVGALLQGLNGVAAALTALPGLIAAIGLQAGVLVLAFKGVGNAIQGAFAAKNVKELNAALEGLTPSARKFVTSLLPLKNLFKDLQFVAQENFFKAFGNSAMNFINNIAPLLRRNVGDIAGILGKAAGDILKAFSGPEFARFIERVIPITEEWIRGFGPAFSTFLIGLIKLSDAALPMLSWLGRLVNSGLMQLGESLRDLAADPKFKQWLAEMQQTLLKLGPLIFSVIQFFVQFLDTLNKAGGDALITNLTTVIQFLTWFLASEAGLRAMNEVIGLAIAAFYALATAVAVFLFLAASIQAFVTWFGDTAIPAIVDGIVWLGLAIADIVKAIGRWFGSWGDHISEALSWIVGLPDRIKSGLGNVGLILVNAGRDLISGFLNGIKQMVPALRDFLRTQVTNLLPSWKGPEDKDRKLLIPAGKAVMEGFGTGIKAGAADIQSMLGDFTTGLGGIGVNNNSTHILFGAGAMNLNFKGALPSSDEAMATGMAVGAGINAQLAARNTRLAVRTL